LASLLPADPQIAEAVASRLRLSRKSVARLAAAAGRDGSDLTMAPQALAYRIGGEYAVDRLLLSAEPEGEIGPKVRLLAGWERPQLSVSGGTLIEMGLKPGPQVARTLQAIKEDWAARGFPSGEREVRDLARAHVDQVLRESQ
jgi:poly(A) polymerase